MKNLKFDSPKQLINDAVKMLIENHLAWSGSDKEMPSRDLGNVRGEFIDAWLDGCYTVDKWDLLSEDEHMARFAYWNDRFNEAAAEADRKWEAAKTLLDL